MIIQPETPADFPQIYQLVKTAFETAAVTDGDEQDYMENLRKSDRYLPQLALVAQMDGEPVGHIMLTRTRISYAAQTVDALLLSPLCVALPWRRQGIGGALIKESLHRALALGFSAVFLCGDPNYYGRFGFRPAAQWQIVNKGNIPPEYVMGCELYPNALPGRPGQICIV